MTILTIEADASVRKLICDSKHCFGNLCGSS